VILNRNLAHKECSRHTEKRRRPAPKRCLGCVEKWTSVYAPWSKAEAAEAEGESGAGGGGGGGEDGDDVRETVRRCRLNR
jgi:hypothetical protein